MTHRVTITQNNGRRAIYRTEYVDVLELLYQLDHCHFKSFSITLDS